MATQAAPKAQASYSGGQAMPAVGTAAYAQAQQMSSGAPSGGISFSGGSYLPPVGSDAYRQAQSGNGQGSYNPTTGVLSITPSAPVPSQAIDPAKFNQPGKIDPGQTIDPAIQNRIPTVNEANDEFMRNNPQYGYNGSSNPTSFSPEVSMTEDNKFKKALTTLQSQGHAPDNAGLANRAIEQATSALGKESTMPSLLGNVMETDSNFDSIFTEYDKHFSPIQQKTSLLQEYQALSSKLGLDAKNAELIDAKRVIEGTEDDVRLEIEKAGGFATESQVQALANARNKSLIKNYNYLLESRDNAMTQLNTMMNLTIQDRQMAESEFDRKMNFAFKVQDYKQKALSDAREGFNNVIKTVGYDGFLNSLGGNQASISRTEKILGIENGGLSQLAFVSEQKRQREISKENLEIEDLQSKINERNRTNTNLNLVTPSVINSQTGKVDPIGQLSSVIRSSGVKSDDKLKLTGSVIKVAQSLAENNSTGDFAGLGPIRAGSWALSQRGQDNRTAIAALEGTVESWMTGASVSNDQAERIKKDLVPREWDTDKQVRNKINALTNYMLNYASGSLASQGVNYSPQNVDLFAGSIVSAPDGQEIIITD